jgi:hypothetical protein
MHTDILGHIQGNRPHILARMEESTPDEPADRGSAAPILIALGIVAFVLIAMTVFRMIGSSQVTEENGVGRAVVAQNDALQREDYAAFRANTCRADQGNQAEVIAGQQRSTAAKGARFVDDVTGIKIDGERATATVVYHFEKAKDDKVSVPITFAREDGGWKVCATGPR